MTDVNEPVVPGSRISHELNEAHKEITRLITLSNRHRQELETMLDNEESIEALRRTLSSQPKLTSRYSGTNAIDFYVKERKYERALIWANSLGDRVRKNVPLMRSVRSLHTKLGNSSRVLELTYLLAEATKSADVEGIHRAEGRFKELHGWIPSIPGPHMPLTNSKKGRVLHLVKESRPYLSNGFTSRSHRNFQAEQEAGLDPVIVTEPGFPENNTHRRTEKVDGIPHVRLGAGAIDYSMLPSDEFLQLFADLAYEEVLRLQPELIHVSSGRRGFETALVGLALKAKTGLPLVYEVRSFFEANWTGDIEIESQGETFEARLAVEQTCMKLADRVLTICDSMKDELISRGIEREKIGVIPNAVDLEQFEPRVRNKDLCAKFSLKKVPTFGYVSNMDHYREGQELLIKASALLQEQGIDHKCILVGSGPRLGYLKQLAADLAVADRVVFTGSIDHSEIQDYYSLIDVFVVPRVAERAARYVTPLKPFEAMAQKKPLIVSRLPALSEIVDSPHRGLTFKTGDVDDLAKTITTLLLDQSLQLSLGQAGYDWVRSNRTWDLNGARYINEFHMVMKEARN